jgi:hypothetical protein
MLSLRDKERGLINDPPIEIGGYKYYVPTGRCVTSVMIDNAEILSKKAQPAINFKPTELYTLEKR